MKPVFNYFVSTNDNLLITSFIFTIPCKATPPLYGDYEAQRHFMEIAHNLNISQWYRYDLKYWGLDYPPITAVHSKFLGQISDFIEPSWISLDSSRGHESASHKLFMRWSVIVSDVVYFTGAYKYADDTKNNLVLPLLLLNPCLIIIDHGHFQYNSIMLGLVLWALYFFKKEEYVFGSVSFCLALGFKHMSLYYSLALFSFLLGKVFKRKDFLLFLKLALAVIITFGLIFGPFYFADGVDGLLQVFKRLFPLQRGLFEDKVGNFWCALNVLVKLREKFDVSTLAKISAGFTLIGCLPSCLIVFQKPSESNLIKCLLCCSLSFFLFSFQVHEKTILVPLTVSFLAVYETKPQTIINLDVILWFVNIAMFSMFPLLLKDGLMIAYISLLLMWNNVCKLIFYKSKRDHLSFLLRFIINACYIIALSVHLAQIFWKPPQKYPDIYPVLNSVISAGCFIIMLLYFNLK